MRPLVWLLCFAAGLVRACVAGLDCPSCPACASCDKYKECNDDPILKGVCSAGGYCRDCMTKAHRCSSWGCIQWAGCTEANCGSWWNSCAPCLRCLAIGENEICLEGDKVEACQPRIFSPAYFSGQEYIQFPDEMHASWKSKITTALTAEAYIKLESFGDWRGIVGLIEDTGSYERGWILGHHDGKIMVAVAGGGNGLTYVKEGSLEIGVWTHVAMTYDGHRGTMTAWKDGRKVSETGAQEGAISYQDSSKYGTGLWGMTYKDSNEAYITTGYLAYYAVYNRVFSAVEIRASAARKLPIVNDYGVVAVVSMAKVGADMVPVDFVTGTASVTHGGSVTGNGTLCPTVDKPKTAILPVCGEGQYWPVSMKISGSTGNTFVLLTSEDGLTHTDAGALCASQGLKLATVDSDEERLVLNSFDNYLPPSLPPTAGLHAAWIGGRRLAGTRTWIGPTWSKNTSNVTEVQWLQHKLESQFCHQWVSGDFDNSTEFTCALRLEGANHPEVNGVYEWRADSVAPPAPDGKWGLVNTPGVWIQVSGAQTCWIGWNENCPDHCEWNKWVVHCKEGAIYTAHQEYDVPKDEWEVADWLSDFGVPGSTPAPRTSMQGCSPRVDMCASVILSSPGSKVQDVVHACAYDHREINVVDHSCSQAVLRAAICEDPFPVIDQSRCDVQPNPAGEVYGDWEYLFSLHPQTWESSLAAARSWGGDLASITNAEEQDLADKPIAGLAGLEQNDHGEFVWTGGVSLADTWKTDAVWIGGNGGTMHTIWDDKIDGTAMHENGWQYWHNDTWSWSDGSAWNFTQWADGEPELATIEATGWRRTPSEQKYPRAALKMRVQPISTYNNSVYRWDVCQNQEEFMPHHEIDGDNSCALALDGKCDEPSHCSWGTDADDCRTSEIAALDQHFPIYGMLCGSEHFGLFPSCPADPSMASWLASQCCRDGIPNCKGFSWKVQSKNVALPGLWKRRACAPALLTFSRATPFQDNCVKCPAGKYSDMTIATACKDCQPGHVVVGGTRCTNSTNFFREKLADALTRYPHCREDRSWKQILSSWDPIFRNGDASKKSWMTTGGLGKLMIEDEFEVWICLPDNMCSTEDKVFCFVFDEKMQVFVPWGNHVDLKLL